MRIMFGAAAFVTSVRPVFMSEIIAALKSLEGGPKVVVGSSTSDAQNLHKL